MFQFVSNSCNLSNVARHCNFNYLRATGKEYSKPLRGSKQSYYKVAQKLWPKRSGLLWPYHLRNESESSWNTFLSSAIRGFYQNNTKIRSFFVHSNSFQSFSATSDQLLLLIHITSSLASCILLTLKKMRALSSQMTEISSKKHMVP